VVFKPQHVIGLLVAVALLVALWLISEPFPKGGDEAAEAFVRASPEIVQFVGPIKSIRRARWNAGHRVITSGGGGPKCSQILVIFDVEGEAKTSRVRVGLASLNDGPWQLKLLAPQTEEEGRYERGDTDGFGCR
jgi:hypothetical protein